MQTLLMVVAAVLIAAWLLHRRKSGLYFANAGTAVTPFGLATRRADAAIATRYLLVKIGTDVDHVAINGATDLPLGVCTDEAEAAEDVIAVNLLGSNNATQRMVASAVINLGDLVYTAANGKIRSAPTGATVYKVGRALQAATADGHVIEVEPCFPTAVTFA